MFTVHNTKYNGVDIDAEAGGNTGQSGIRTLNSKDRQALNPTQLKGTSLQGLACSIVCHYYSMIPKKSHISKVHTDQMYVAKK
jgi:hypothetical protein